MQTETEQTNVLNTENLKWLKELRETAAQRSEDLKPDVSRWTRLSLPEEISPLSKKISLTDTFDTERKPDSIVLINDTPLKTTISDELASKGVILSDIAAALDKHPDLIEKYLGKAVACDDKLSALNLQYFTNGLFLYVPRGVKISVPITSISCILSGSNVWSRNLIVVEQDAKVSLVEDMKSAGKENSHSLFSSVLEIFVGDNAELNLSTVQNLGENVTFLRQARAVVGRDSRINWTTGTLGGRIVRSKRETVFNGPGSEVNDIEVFFGANSQHFDLTTNILHKKPATKSNVIVKGILKDRARGLAYGLIRIDKGAKGSDSFLAEHGLILNSEARCDTTPSLEIEESDVKAGHSASVAQINEEQLFYMTSRGIDRDTARKMIALSFLNPIVKKLSPPMQERVQRVMEEKWR